MPLRIVSWHVAAGRVSPARNASRAIAGVNKHLAHHLAQLAALGEVLLGRHPLDADALVDDVDLHGLKDSVELLNGLAAPTVGPESRADQVPRTQALHVGHQVRDRREDVVV